MSVLKSVGLTKVYKKSTKPALDSFTIEIEEGQIFTLLGRNGAGKTTFLRIAGTQLLPTSGTITVLGFDAVKQAKEVRKRIAFTPQEAETIYPLTPRDHIMLSLRMRGMDKAEAAQRTNATMEELELTVVADKNTSWLSGGFKQRVMVAMSLATDAELLFLDEPSIGLDPVSRRKVWEQLTRLKDAGRTIILTTHYMDEAEALSDNLAIINKGRIVAEGTAQSITKFVSSETTRIDVYDKFEEDELKEYGRVVRIASRLRVLTSSEKARKLSEEALARGADISIAPVTLDDVFVDIVGEAEKGEENEE
ncbi:MAG TPA: ABC transporter ATP-binding protein [Methanomassiliicoccales archaeon]|nr:ABC transporter ATP-binding protein [Methanomassiliicoccales archaeon]